MPRAIEDRLQNFLQVNSEARTVEKAYKLAASDNEDEEPEIEKVIEKPWGDDSIELIIPDRPGRLISALNAVRLPPRLLALWHRKEEMLEIIFTAYKKTTEDEELVNRVFDFHFEDKKFSCGFGRSSNRLIEIAKNSIPVKVSSTSHRNLSSFRAYARRPDFPGIGTPTSFWISGLNPDSEKCIDVLRHINFYMTYFDKRTPWVEIISADLAPEDQINIRYISGGFPSNISGHKIDENIISFWLSARNGNAMFRYLLYYRIIEFCATEYIDAKTRAAVEKIMAQPNLLDNRTEAASAVMQVLVSGTESRHFETKNVIAMIRNSTDTTTIAKYVEHHKNAFSKDTVFEGGFTLPKLVGSPTQAANFSDNLYDALAMRMRDLRNALSHGRDIASSGVILPSERNRYLMVPWLNLIEIIAVEVVIYRRLA